jgi:hypothetical protein
LESQEQPSPPPPPPRLAPITRQDRIRYVIEVIEKETKQDHELVEMLVYTGFSNYTNNPMNLMVNSRKPGEGKTHPIMKVMSYFPEEDVIVLVGSSDKALYHEKGPLVVKDEETGKWVDIQPTLAELEQKIAEAEQDCDNEKIKKLDRHQRINEIKKQKAELMSKASKLISLEHKILVFLDTPNTSLLEAAMPLISHDVYESKYKFTDKTSGGKLEARDNILWGWPTVIFAQTIDITHRKRFPELARRFIIVNPSTTNEKVVASVDLATDSGTLPDLAYQAEVVTDREKSRAKSIVRDIKLEILEVMRNLRRPDGKYDKDKSSVFAPFDFALKAAFPKRDMNDVTNVKRFLSFQTLSTLTSINIRPVIKAALNEKALDPTARAVVKLEDLKSIVEIPIAVFDDTAKAIELMKDASNTGLRPEQNKWFDEVFMRAFAEQKGPKTKVKSDGKEAREDRRALTVEDLTRATEKHWHELVDPKKIRDDYLEPLCNNGAIVKADSEIDKRANIYFPVIELFHDEELSENENEENKKLRRNDFGRNFLEDSKLHIRDITKIPTKEAIKSRIQVFLKYYAEKGYTVGFFDGRETEIDLDTLVNVYFNEDEMKKCFEVAVIVDVNFDVLSAPSGRINSEEVENRDDSQTQHENDVKPIEPEEQDSTKLCRNDFGHNFLSNGNSSSSSTVPEDDEEDFFMQTFDDLAKESDGGMMIVKQSTFRMALISSGRFHAGGAIQAINEALKLGKLKSIGFDELCRR